MGSDIKTVYSILGRMIGFARSWDEINYSTVVYYGFIPNPGFDLPSGDLVVDLDKGVWQVDDGKGNPIGTGDIVTLLEKSRRTLEMAQPTHEQIIAFIEKCMEERQTWARSEDGYRVLGPGSPPVPGMQEYDRILRYVRDGDKREVVR